MKVNQVPKQLLKQIRDVLPPSAEVVCPDFHYEDEDYTILVYVEDEQEVVPTQDTVWDITFAWDTAHGTDTFCPIWTKEHKRFVAMAGEAVK